MLAMLCLLSGRAGAKLIILSLMDKQPIDWDPSFELEHIRLFQCVCGISGVLQAWERSQLWQSEGGQQS
jgi:hypothetical protein